jgi:hypothetical protein
MNEEQLKLVGAPRILRVFLGLVVLFFSSLSLVGSILLVARPPEKNPSFAVSLGIAFTIVCCWGIVKSFQIINIFSTKDRASLSPAVLRIAAVLFLFLPLGGLFLNAYSLTGKGIRNILMALVEVSAAGTLFKLASARAANKASSNSREEKDNNTA